MSKGGGMSFSPTSLVVHVFDNHEADLIRVMTTVAQVCEPLSLFYLIFRIELDFGEGYKNDSQV